MQEDIMITIRLGRTVQEMADGVAALKEAGLTNVDVTWDAGCWIATVRD
jgi:hypothetical protein